MGSTNLLRASRGDAVPACKLIPIVLVLSCAGSCKPSTPVGPEPPAPPTTTQQTQQSNLLLFPMAEAEDLLGRAVHATPEGGWTIAEARAPGCEVSVRKTKAEFSTRRQVNLHDMTSVSVGFAKFVGFEAKYGRSVVADIQIDNTEILKADTRGTCGDLIVDSVFVGRGRRLLSLSSEVGGKAGVTISGVTPGAEHSSGSNIIDTTEWKTDQAYGFSTRKVANVQPLDVTVRLPSTVQDGELVDISVETSRKAYLVVYYLESDGKAELLWPSNEEPEPTAEPGRAAPIPSQKEKMAGISIKAALRNPAEEAREMLVVYAFTEKGDFDRLKPAVGSSDTNGAAYAAQLTRRIGDIPMSRWSRSLTSYVIAPKKKKG
ncbi:MAG: DUF4384 domain-containing protein [Deltaproteobacteria bacterium]|nr:DUF4384 domain-containing protein [Deltaproteobacteria bacterium]